MSEIIKGEITVRRGMEILYSKSEVVPTVEELRIILRDCANSDSPLLGIITARDLVKGPVLKLDFEDRVALAGSPEFALLGMKLGPHLNSFYSEENLHDPEDCPEGDCNCE